jgi:hypothetical protein
VSDALVFFAGLAIELGELESDEPKKPKAPAPPPKPRAKPVASKVRWAPTARPTTRFSLGLSAGVRGGIAPEPRPYAAFGFEASSTSERVVAPAFRLAVIGAWSRLSASNGEASLLLIGGRAEACPLHFGSERIGFRPCAAFEAAPVFASGEIDVDPKHATEPWLAVESMARVQWHPNDRFYVELDAGVLFPLRRSRYYFEPNETLYEVPAVTGRAALGVGFVF